MTKALRIAYFALGASVGAVAMMVASEQCHAACLPSSGSVMTCTTDAPPTVNAWNGVTVIAGDNPTAMAVMGATDDAARADSLQAAIVAQQNYETEVYIYNTNTLLRDIGATWRLREVR